MFLYVLLLKCYNKKCTNFRPIFCVFFLSICKLHKNGGDFLGFLVQNVELGCVAHTVRHPKIIFQFQIFKYQPSTYKPNNPSVNLFI